MPAAIDWSPIWDSVVAALAAGLGITLAFAIAVRGLVRASELRGEGRDLAAGAWAAAGTLALLAAVGGVAAGLLIVAGDGPLL